EKVFTVDEERMAIDLEKIRHQKIAQVLQTPWVLWRYENDPPIRACEVYVLVESGIYVHLGAAEHFYSQSGTVEDRLLSKLVPADFHVPVNLKGQIIRDVIASNQVPSIALLLDDGRILGVDVMGSVVGPLVYDWKNAYGE